MILQMVMNDESEIGTYFELVTDIVCNWEWIVKVVNDGDVWGWMGMGMLYFRFGGARQAGCNRSQKAITISTIFGAKTLVSELCSEQPYKFLFLYEVVRPHMYLVLTYCTEDRSRLARWQPRSPSYACICLSQAALCFMHRGHLFHGTIYIYIYIRVCTRIRP